ncbi:hypothetical protein KAW18_11640 [candidate division WOR-3 bacterium]|nr:hypothetical protein [candidate division WOR-3 bacterium]
MIPYLGDFVEYDVVYLMFNTFTSDDPSASCTITNLLNTDVHIHKDDSVDQRNNAAGITVSVNFDGITGSHMIKIDTNDNTVAGFWVTGHDYFVRIEGTTIDGATINAVVAHFSIQNRFMRGTNSANTVVPDAAGVAPTVGEIRTEMEGAGSKLLAIEGYTDKIDDGTNGLTAIKAEVEGLAGATMRGTDGANTVVPDAAGTAPTSGEIRTEMEGAGTKLTNTLGDTNELQTDWKNGGRLDLIIDIIAADTTTDIPAKLLKYIQLLSRSDAAIATDNATELTAINADGGSGAGNFSNQTDGIEAIRDRGDAAWSAGAANPNMLLDAEIATVTDQTHFTLATGSDVDDAYKDQTIVIYDDTNSDFPSVRKANAYTGATKTITLDSAPDFTLGADDSIKIFATAPGTTAPTVGEIRTELEGVGTKLTNTLDDTNELQTDWKNGGRLDIILDSNSTNLAKIKSIVGFIRTKIL